MPEPPTPFRISLLLVFLLHVSTTWGDIQTIRVVNDTSGDIKFETFGFTSRGRLSLSVSSVSIINTTPTITPNLSHIGFFAMPLESYELSEFPCIFDNPNITNIFSFSQLSPPPEFSRSKLIAIKKPENYAVAFATCGVHELKISMVIHLEIYNLGANGEKDYLSDGETQVPPIYFLFSMVYVAFVVVWLNVCRQNKLGVKQIHMLMAILLFGKALNLFFLAETKYHIKILGTPRGWDTIYCMFQILRGLLFFVVTVLISKGWSLIEAHVQPKVKWIMVIGIPLQVFENFAYFMMTTMEDVNNGDDATAWFMIFFLLDTVCGFLIMYPISWSVYKLRTSPDQEGTALTTLKKLRIFRDFYYAVYFYTLGVKGIAFGFKCQYVLEYKNRWRADFFMEAASLGFYVIMFYLFRPHESNKYLALATDDKEEDVALAEIRSHEFERLP